MNRIEKLLNKFSINETVTIQQRIVDSRLSGYGTKTSAGFLFEEYNDRFIDRYERYKTFLQMDQDNCVYRLRNSIKLSKLATNFFVDPYEEDGKTTPKDEEIAKFVNKCLFEKMQRRAFIDQINLYIRDGFSLFEVTFKKDTDGKYYPILTRIECSSVFKRKQTDGSPGIQQITRFAKDTNEIPDIDKNVGENNIDIPANKLLLFNINQEGTNYEGWSLYRKIAKDRFMKDKLENYHAVYQERLGVPPIKITVPQGTQDDKVKLYQDTAMNLRSHESGFVTKYVDDQGNTLADFEWMQGSTATGNMLIDAIRYYEQTILDSFFAQFLYLGKSTKGSYGLGDASMRFYFHAVKSLLEDDIEVINKYLIPKIVALNFGEVERMPKLKFGNLGFIDESAFTEVISSLVTGGIITKNYELENYTRELLHLPKLSEEEYEEEKEKALQALQPQPMGAEEPTQEEEVPEIDEGELDDLEGQLDDVDNEEFSDVVDGLIDFSERAIRAFAGPMSAEAKAKISQKLKDRWSGRKKGDIDSIVEKTGSKIQEVQERMDKAKDDYESSVSDIQDKLDDLNDIKDSLSGKASKGKKAEIKAKVKELRKMIKDAKKKRDAFLKEQRWIKKELEKASKAGKEESKRQETESKEKEKEKKKIEKEKSKKKKHSLDDELLSIFNHQSIIDEQVKNYTSTPTIQRSYSSPVVEDGRRPLTFAERKVNIKNIKTNQEKADDKLLGQYGMIVEKQVDNVLEQTKKIIDKNDTKAISDITLKYGPELTTVVASSYKENFDYGKNEASREIGVEIPKTKRETNSLINVQAEALALGILSRAESITKTVLLNQIVNKGGIANTPSAEIVSMVKSNLNDYFNQASSSLVTVGVSQAFNSGRKSIAEGNSKLLYGAQYSAILDGRTSRRCMSLDGRTVRVGSPDFNSYSPPQHAHCRSMRVFINNQEEFKPDLEEIPSTIPIKDTINSKEELKDPVLEAGSPAIRQIKQEIEWRKQKLESQTGKTRDNNQDTINRLEKAISKAGK